MMELRFLSYFFELGNEFVVIGMPLYLFYVIILQNVMSQTSKKKNVDVINAGVIRYPIHHSKSPLIQNYFINTHNLNAVYKKYEIKDEVELKSFTHRVLNGNWAGFNITIPYKQTIIPFLNTIDEDVKCIGACNTVVIRTIKCMDITLMQKVYYQLE